VFVKKNKQQQFVHFKEDNNGKNREHWIKIVKGDFLLIIIESKIKS
jgi:hypothetical protein